MTPYLLVPDGCDWSNSRFGCFIPGRQTVFSLLTRVLEVPKSPTGQTPINISPMNHQLDATLQVLFLKGHFTCFGSKRPSSEVFKTSTAATGTRVIVAGQSSHLLITASGSNKEM